MENYNFFYTTKHPNNVIITATGKILSIDAIYSFNKDDSCRTIKDVVLEGFAWHDLENLFSYPLSSSRIEIYKMSKKSKTLSKISGADVRKKCILTKVMDETVAISLLH